MNCINCGQNIPAESRFCEYCGAPVNAVTSNREVVYQPSIQQAGTEVVFGGRGIPLNEISTKEPKAKKTKKSFLWIIIIILVVFVCCCVVVIGGGLLYLRNQGQTSWQDVVPSDLGELLDIPEAFITTPISEVAAQPTPQDETAPLENDFSLDNIVMVTSSGIWVVNEQTREAVQISYDPLDAPWDLNEGLSPDKKSFAYITGFGGASVNPMLVVLDLVNQTTLIQLELTGPVIQAGMGGSIGDPAFEALRAIEFTGSIAWSPDGNRLAFIAALDGNSADVYLFNRDDNSISRLTEESGHAFELHWSPDGLLLQYISVNSFGTGAGFSMEGLWVYDFQGNQTQRLEMPESSGEDFLTWTDASHFLISSWSPMCESYNLRLVDAASFYNQVIVDGCFTASAYDPEQKFGMFSVTQFNNEFCNCGEPMDAGLMIFGEGIGIPIAGDIGRKKFEQLEVYGIDFIPQGNLFTVYGDEGLSQIYYDEGYRLDILPELKGLTPYPSPVGDYWVWASHFQTGLWVTENNNNLVEISPLFSGVPQWSQDGQNIYFFENNRLFLSSAPQFSGGELVVETPGQEILGLIK
ncbi:MAG: hypothetical protein CL609_23520 [Anaerolineaceae bacterium]|nr:hypothetical protein [Anaerolineaceae bacterium]